jgi:hypothetical protein
MQPKGSIPNLQELSTCSCPEPDQSSPHHPIPPLRLGLPSGLLPSGFPTNNLYTLLFSPIRATCLTMLCLTEHHLNYNYGAAYCRKIFKLGGSCIFVHENLKFLEVNLSAFCKEKDLEVFRMVIFVSIYL